MSDSCDENASGGFSSSSSDEEERNNMMMLMAFKYQRRKMRLRNQQPIHGGSTSGRRYIDRDRVAGNDRLINDYFCPDPVYGAALFRRRFRMHRPLFLRIYEHLQQDDDYFVQKCDATGQLGLSGLQNMTAAIRMLAYGMAADAVDEYVRIGESTTIECLKKFCKGIINIFGQEYLRSPNAADIQRLLNKGEQRGFPGMLGSLDCMHWEWKNCPTAYHGQYTGHTHRPTIVLEAVASYDLWIWHAFFGMPGSNNDINVLDASNVFADLRDGRAPAVNYIINGHEYTMGYYLADGIYPQWATIVQTITGATAPKIRHFAKKQESFRKDVERAFGVLQARFAIVRGPARYWYREDLSNIMKTCIILHNMIVKDERVDDNNCEIVEPRTGEYDAHDEDNPVHFSHNSTLPFEEYMNRAQDIRSLATHHALRNDLIEHLWSKHGD
jgi:hypothetical protein